jgi:preprotein translocase subunit SecE
MSEEIKKTEEQKPAKSEKKKEKKPGFFAKAKKFLKELKSEISKIVWPTPKQVLNNTLVVIAVVLLSAVFIGLVDALFKFLAGLIV